EMKSILSLSEILVQKKNNSFNGELKTSGSICENFVKDLLKKCLPQRLRITSGYVLDPKIMTSSENLPQFDILIIDNDYPPIYKFKNYDIEIVPVESVCAILEVKKHINGPQFKKFFSKLNISVSSYNGLTKKTSENSAPLVGIISMTSNFSIENYLKIIREKNIIDFLWSIDGFCSIPVKDIRIPREGGMKEVRRTYIDDLSRPEDDSFSNITEEAWRNLHPYDIDTNNWHYLYDLDKNNPERIMHRVFGWLTLVFFQIKGRKVKNMASLINQYYFNYDIERMIKTM
ncbi:TPA: DUF6602 domain-containing protein, partial [Legionella pneumophila]